MHSPVYWQNKEHPNLTDDKLYYFSNKQIDILKMKIKSK